VFGLNQCLDKLEVEGTPIRTALIGAGSVGGNLVAQINKARGMEIDLVADLKIDNAIRALTEYAGIDQSKIVVCDSLAEADRALRSGTKVCTTNVALAWETKGINVVVEGTGVPQAFAGIALNAIRNKKHLVTLNVEADVCIGHILKMFADNAGVVYTGVYGDEPGCAMLLYEEAAALGFEIVGMGRSDMGGGSIKWNRETIKQYMQGLGVDLRRFDASMYASFCDGSKTNEECCMMANATGLRPDVRGMHGLDVAVGELNFTREIPSLMQHKRNGGILNHTGVVEFIKSPKDVPDAPGWNYIVQFVVVRATTAYEKSRFQKTGAVKGDNRILYSCYHLVAIQAPITIAKAAIDHRAVITPKGPKRSADVVTMAKKDLEAGEIIDEIGGLCVAGRIEVASVTRAEKLLPFALAAGVKVKRPIPKGGFLTYDDVEFQGDPSLLLLLRQLQDRLFEDLH
jgi:predicted homoserine dehydrogenase-like protein